MGKKKIALDIKVLLTTGHIDQREILNTIRMWIDDANFSWDCELEYLMSEYHKHDEYKKRYDKAEIECRQTRPYLIKLRETVDSLLSLTFNKYDRIPIEKLEAVDSLDIFIVLKDICNHQEIEKLILWTSKALDCHLEKKERLSEDNKWEQTYSSLVTLKENLTKLQEKNIADSLKYKMDSLKSRWERVVKLTKKVETTETTVKQKNVEITNVVYAE